jgi:predicted transcriptional regulator
VLKPAVTEVASLFGVSRQTIYDWQNGAQPTQANAGKLEDLAAAADVFVAEGISVTPYLLKRRIAGGKTVFEVFRDGGDTENAARQLAQMVLRESNQRRILEARMAGRKLQKIDYSDAGVPALKERS